MTLNTSFLIDSPRPDPEDVFEFCNVLIGATNKERKWRHRSLEESHFSNPYYSNEPGQGYPAWLWVFHGVNGEPLKYESWETEEEDPSRVRPEGYIQVDFDTAYGYTDEYGRQCNDLHADYVTALAQWCKSEGWQFAWQNEYTGEWFPDADEVYSILAHDGNKAQKWFNEVAIPALKNAYPDIRMF